MALWAFIDATNIDAGDNPVRAYKRAPTRSALLRYLSFRPDDAADWQRDRIELREDPAILVRNQKNNQPTLVYVCKLEVI